MAAQSSSLGWEPGAVAAAAPPLRLAAVRCGGPFPRGEFPEQDRSYFRDLMASYGAEVPESGFEQGRTTYREMVEALLPSLGPWRDGFDLAVLAFSTTDAEAGWPGCYLVDAVDRPGIAFAISDQGPTVPFTGLRLTAGSSRTHGARRAQLWILDQSNLLHDLPVPDRLAPTGDMAVAMVFDDSDGYELLEMSHLTDVAADRVPELLQQTVRGLVPHGAGSIPLTAVWGCGIPPAVGEQVPVDHTEWVAAGLPCTGVWVALSRILDAGSGQGNGERGLLLVADYDEDLRYLGICVLATPYGGPELRAWR